MQRWEYMTWRVERLAGPDARVRTMNGEEFDGKERPPFYEALTRSGDGGWELVGMDGNTFVFKRPKAED